MHLQGLGVISPGKKFSPAAQRSAVAYNASHKSSVGWAAKVSGTKLAQAVYALQSWVFTADKDRDGKLGDRSRAAFVKLQAKLPPTTLGPPGETEAVIAAIVNGSDAKQILSAENANEIFMYMGWEKKSAGKPSGGGVPGPPVDRAGIGGGDNTMLYGLALLGLGFYFWKRKKK